MASSLTPEQRARIERNRQIALEKRAAKLAKITLSNSPPKKMTCHESLCTSILPPTNLQKKDSSNLSHTTIKDNTSLVSVVSTTSNSKPNSTFSSSNQGSSNFSTFHQSKLTCDTSSNYARLDLNIAKSQNKAQSSTDLKQSVCKSNTLVQGKPQNKVVGFCKLVSKDRFAVDLQFQQQAIDIFKTIRGKEYDSVSRLWTFPVQEYFNFRKAISVLKPYIIVEDLPNFIVETFITKSRVFQQDFTKVDISRLDEKLRETIYPFQKEGIQFGISKGGRCLIADDMGLGKSIQALGIANFYLSDWPLLIVCPSSMRFQWEEEVKVNLPNTVQAHRIYVMTSGKDDVEDAKVLILSYDLLVKKKDLVMKMGFGVVIMDESHSIKSSKTQRGKVSLELARQCKRLILLSGTPILSRPSELYTQIQAIHPTAFPYFKAYGIRYCNGTQTKFGWDFSGSSNMEELKILLETRFMIRRLKSSVLTQLPGKIRQVITLKSQSLRATNDSMDAFALKLQSSSLKGSERHSTLLAYFAETSKLKCAAVCEYISDLLLDNRKFLCFAHHADMLDAICHTLEKNKTYYIRIDGSVSAEDRKVLCDKFQYEDKWIVAVLSIKAANTGLTLTAAQVVIFAELFWNPGDLVQAEDRVHRIGQEDCVVVKYLIAKGTADDYLWPLIQSKLEVLNKAGLSKESHMAADTKDMKGKEICHGTQTKIDDFLKNAFDDEEDEELFKVMEEIEEIQ